MTSTDTICRTVWPSLYRYVLGATGEPDLAQDIAQEALARTLSARPDLAGLRDPTFYVLRVATNLVRDELRSRARRRRRRQLLNAQIEEGHEGRVTDAIAVGQLLAGLPPRQRLALSLRYGADRSVADTARIMGCAEGTVKALSHQGLARLRQDADL